MFDKKYYTKFITNFSVLIAITSISIVLLVLTEKNSIFNKIATAFVVSGITTIFTKLVVMSNEDCKQYEFELVAEKRSEYKGFYDWVSTKNNQDLFIAGRSVLDKINEGLIRNGFKNIYDSMLFHLKNGKNIKILFLDPSKETIKEIAASEERNGTNSKIYSEIYKSLKISCDMSEKIDNILKNETYKFNGSLFIRIYNQVNQYSYHCLYNDRDMNVDNSDIYVGFYFQNEYGGNGPLFKANNKCFKMHLIDHFKDIFSHSTPLLSFCDNKLEFDDKLYEICLESLRRLQKHETE